MSRKNLSDSDRKILLQLARQALEKAVGGEHQQYINKDEYSASLREKGASFVTLTRDGELRGCIGALEAYQPLVVDVCEHAAAAAVEDFRFKPVQLEEIREIHIEISRLTAPEPLAYSSPEDLVKKLRPYIDGVILRDGIRRATFLPQVWKQLPEPEEFLRHLCQKMGASPDMWKHKPLGVEIYEVEEFEE